MAELTRLKHLAEENRKLKQLVAGLSLENQVSKKKLRTKRRGARQHRAW